MIETARLILRRPTLADLDPVHAMRSDPEVVRFVGGKTLTREEAWHRLQRNAGHWSLLGYGLFTVVTRAGGVVVGEIGLIRAERGLGPSFDPFPEAAWILSREAHGRGYATEAAQAAHDWFMRTQPATRTVCIIDPRNAGSLKVAQKLGYRSFGSTCYHGDMVTMLERPVG